MNVYLAEVFVVVFLYWLNNKNRDDIFIHIISVFN